MDKAELRVVERRYEWVFLDAGDTLFRVAEPGSGFEAALAELGYVVPSEQLAAVIERARAEALGLDHLGPGPDYAVDAERARARRERLVAAILGGVGVPERDFAACGAAVREAFVGAHFFRLYPEVRAVLKRLTGAGYRLGIISNWEPRLELLCRNHGLAEYFQFVLASEAEGFAKPGPYLFRRGLELAGAEPGRCVQVGDSYELDVLGARAVGIEAILLDRGGYYPRGTWEPTIASLDQLPALVQEPGGPSLVRGGGAPGADGATLG